MTMAILPDPLQLFTRIETQREVYEPHEERDFPQ